MINNHTLSINRDTAVSARGAFQYFDDKPKKKVPRLIINIGGSEITLYFDGIAELKKFTREVKKGLLQSEHGYNYKGDF
jgi:hypothetical protein